MEVERMNKKVLVKEAFIENLNLLLKVDENITLDKCSAKEQMLVDSNEFAFVYILEMDGEYTYLFLPEGIWPILKDALGKSLNPILTNGLEKLPLPMFMEELTYVIDNIKGNSNYGEEMVEKVENTF
jgi:hypothetical protein